MRVAHPARGLAAPRRPAWAGQSPSPWPVSAVVPTGTALRVVLTTAVVLALALTLLAGWPFWHRYPLLAAPNAAYVVGLVVTAGYLFTRRTYGAGLLFLSAGVCWSLSWLMSWGSGPAPLAGSLLQALFWFLQAWLLLAYPDGRVAGRLDTAVVAVTGLALVGDQAVVTVLVCSGGSGSGAGTSWLSHALFPPEIARSVLATSAA